MLTSCILSLGLSISVFPDDFWQMMGWANDGIGGLNFLRFQTTRSGQVDFPIWYYLYDSDSFSEICANSLVIRVLMIFLRGSMDIVFSIKLLVLHWFPFPWNLSQLAQCNPSALSSLSSLKNYFFNHLPCHSHTSHRSALQSHLLLHTVVEHITQ